MSESRSVVSDFVTPWVQSMEFSRPEYWSVPFPPPRDLPKPGIEPRSPALQADSSPAEPQGKLCNHKRPYKWEAERSVTQKRRQCDHTGRDWSGAPTS